MIQCSGPASVTHWVSLNDDRARRRLPPSVWLMIPSLLVLGALLGVTIVGVAHPEAAPPAIGGAVPVGEVPVTSTKYLDVRSVTLAFETQLQGEIVTPVGGFITRTSCAVGGEAQSGESGIAINGRSLVYLASGAPLWRDLGPDSVGSDVRGLQTELNRLGYSLDADGEFGPLTQRLERHTSGGFRLDPRTCDGDHELSDSSRCIRRAG
jgi:hypothetical protein